MDEEGQPNPSPEKGDPLTNLLIILKSSFLENMKNTRKNFEMLAKTHDEAKNLIEGMAEKYRKLQVFLKRCKDRVYCLQLIFS